jgi:hypothetical protein
VLGGKDWGESRDLFRDRIANWVQIAADLRSAVTSHPNTNSAVTEAAAMSAVASWTRRAPRRTASTPAPAKIAATMTSMNTMPVVIITSLRVGQVTLEVSERTSWRNWKGLNFAMSVSPVCGLKRNPSFRRRAV